MGPFLMSVSILSVGAWYAGARPIMETPDLEPKEWMNFDTMIKRPSLRSRQKSADGYDDYALYSYDGGPGTSNWRGNCSSGSSQSPIDLGIANISFSRKRIEFRGADQRPTSTEYHNSGQTVKIKLQTPKPIQMWGGPFGNNTFVFQQMHLHWGANMSEGSEHTFASESFPLEAHLVFYKDGVENATEVTGGIAVLGMIYKRSLRRNLALDEMVKSIDDIIQPQSSVLKDGGKPLFEYLPRKPLSYYHYVGSLTTPPCTEGVTWVVFNKLQNICKEQIDQFRKMKDDNGRSILYNYRETQPLNGRQLHRVKTIQ